MPADRLVGEAYVLMRADGRLLKGDIKKLGGDSAKTYAQQWEKELESARKTLVTRFQREVSKATAEVDFSRFRREFGSIEDTVRGLRAELGKLSFDANGKLLPLKERQLLKGTYDQIVKALQQWQVETEEVEAKHRSLNRHLVSYGEIFERSIIDKWKKYATVVAQATQSGNWEKLRRENESVAVTVNRVGQELEDNRVHLRLYDEDIKRSTDSLARWAEQQAKIDLERGTQRVVVNGRTVRRESSQFVQALRNMDDEVGIFSVTFGRAFGKGSRNNFVNWIGSVVQGMTALVTVVPAKVITGLGEAVDGFMGAFSAARAANIGVFGSALRGVAGIFTGKGGIVGLLVAGGAAAFAFGKVLPAVISAVSLLASIATAFVGAVGVGLVGALLAVAPAAVAAAAGIGVLVTAIGKFLATDAGKKKLKEFNAALNEFTDSIQKPISRLTGQIFDGILALFDELTPRVGLILSDLSRRLEAPDVLDALDKWKNSIGVIFTDLGIAANRFIVGLIKFFVPILPYAERLAEKIRELAVRFDTWISTTEGKNSVADFMDTAWEAAGRVARILGGLATAIGKIFLAGTKQTGLGFLETWETKIREFNSWLDKPENKAKLNKWFEDGKQLAKDIGDIIGDVVRAFDTLDSDQGRQTVQDFADAIVTIADTAADITTVADKVGQLVGYITRGGAGLKLLFDIFNAGKPEFVPQPGAFGNTQAPPAMPPGQSAVLPKSPFMFGGGGEARPIIADPRSQIEQIFGGIPALIEELLSSVPGKVFAIFSGIPGLVLTALAEFGPVLLSVFGTAVESAMTFLTSFPGRVFTALLGIPGLAFSALAPLITQIPAVFQAAIEGAMTWLTSFPGRVVTALAGIPGLAFSTLQPIVGKLGGIASDAVSTVVRNLQGLPGRVAVILSAIPGAAYRAAVGIISTLGGIMKSAWTVVSGWIDSIRALFSGIAARASAIRDTIVSTISRNIPMASGGVLYGPTNILAGEAGREAIVPLDRPLSQVDPSVRALAAIAQGKVPALAAGGVVGSSGGSAPVVFEDGAVRVTTAATNPWIVAQLVQDTIADVFANA